MSPPITHALALFIRPGIPHKRLWFAYVERLALRLRCTERNGENVGPRLLEEKLGDGN